MPLFDANLIRPATIETVFGWARPCPYPHCNRMFLVPRGDDAYRRHLNDHAPDNIANGLFGPRTQEELPSPPC